MIVGKHYTLRRQVFGTTTYYSILEHIPEKQCYKPKYWGTDLKKALDSTVPEQLTLDLDWED